MSEPTQLVRLSSPCTSESRRDTSLASYHTYSTIYIFLALNWISPQLQCKLLECWDCVSFLFIALVPRIISYPRKMLCNICHWWWSDSTKQTKWVLWQRQPPMQIMQGKQFSRINRTQTDFYPEHPLIWYVCSDLWQTEPLRVEPSELEGLVDILCG